MKARPRGDSGADRRHASFIRLRPDAADTIQQMGSTASGGQHLTEDQIDRAQEVARKLLALFPPERGSKTRLENASKAVGVRLKQQTVSALLLNRQCGYFFATALMAYAKSRPELASLPPNYIIAGNVGVDNVGTHSAPSFARRPMKYRAKGEYLDTLVGSLPADFLDFTAGRDPVEPHAEGWGQADWFAHVARELEFWKYVKAQKKTR